jgi:hypothetical protein
MTAVLAQDAPRTVVGRRFNFAAIGATLGALQREFPDIWRRLDSPCELLDTQIVRNMLAGYAYVDGLLSSETDLFAVGNSPCWLELNALVLCGTDPAQRADLADHLAATEERFYNEPGGGIRDVIAWYDRHRGESVWKRAAGTYIRVLSDPQLYLEGNHRCGMLIMSYILGREKYPPIVLTPAAAEAFFEPSAAIKQLRKRGLSGILRMRMLTNRFARAIEQHANRDYLVPQV